MMVRVHHTWTSTTMLEERPLYCNDLAEIYNILSDESDDAMVAYYRTVTNCQAAQLQKD